MKCSRTSAIRDDETDREYIELIGTPGADLTGYYFVVFEGEEEENSGAGSGRADFVIDLSPYTFGANGILTFVPGDPSVAGLTWEYASIADPDVEHRRAHRADGRGRRLGGFLADLCLDLAAPRLPLRKAPITTRSARMRIATAETRSAPASAFSTNCRPDAQWIDSVGIVEGGSGDRDRVATPPSLGHPGIHVHQPTSVLAPGNTAVAADAISRRFGQTLPNSIGVWYNGDISNGNPAGAPIRYLEDSAGFISVVAPDGAVLTPGAPNILRNVYFRVYSIRTRKLPRPMAA